MKPIHYIDHIEYRYFVAGCSEQLAPEQILNKHVLVTNVKDLVTCKNCLRAMERK